MSYEYRKETESITIFLVKIGEKYIKTADIVSLDFIEEKLLVTNRNLEGFPFFSRIIHRNIFQARG